MTEISNKPITKAQIQSIHAALSAQGIDDATYRRLLLDFGASSSTNLTRQQAHQFLNLLGRYLPQPPGSGPARTPEREAVEAVEAVQADGLDGTSVVRLATPPQRQLIEKLVREIPWREPDAYQAWLCHTMGLRRPATVAQASDVIEGLKAIKAKEASGNG